MRIGSSLRRSLAILAVLSIAALLAAACSFRVPAPDFRSEPRATEEPTRVAEAQRQPQTPGPTPAQGSNERLPQTPTPQRQQASVPAGAVLNVVEVAARVRPAVAQILIRSGSSANPFFEPVPSGGEGSGVVFDSRGYVLTNNHVVEGAGEIVVSLPEREKTYTARLVGRDPSTDLAVVQIDPDNLPLAPLGDSDRLQVGEPVVAIGNALGLEGGPTVTSGVVSALNRTIDEPTGATLYQLIQTDAAINPGNSGGPLINMSGEVIGINTAVATGSSMSPAQGIGFAISVNSAKPIIDDLLAYGKVRRPYLGVELADVTPAIARQYQLRAERGAYIVRLVRGGPAARAGMETGDIIVRIESEPIRGVADLRKTLTKLKIGQRVQVEVVRGSGNRTFDVALAEMPSP